MIYRCYSLHKWKSGTGIAPYEPPVKVGRIKAALKHEFHAIRQGSRPEPSSFTTARSSSRRIRHIYELPSHSSGTSQDQQLALLNSFHHRLCSCIFQTDSYPEAELSGGLQEDGVPLVPPPQLFPQGLQLAQEFLDLGAAWVPCTDQPAALLRRER